MSKSARPAFNPRSAAPTLRYVGAPRVARGAPARDLSDADLARLAWVGLNPRPATVNDTPTAAIAAIRDELVGTGLYTATQPTED